jgi:hypothetical protein
MLRHKEWKSGLLASGVLETKQFKEMWLIQRDVAMLIG